MAPAKNNTNPNVAKVSLKSRSPANAYSREDSIKELLDADSTSRHSTKD
jgi:hypothetical protein